MRYFSLFTLGTLLITCTFAILLFYSVIFAQGSPSIVQSTKFVKWYFADNKFQFRQLVNQNNLGIISIPIKVIPSNSKIKQTLKVIITIDNLTPHSAEYSLNQISSTYPYPFGMPIYKPSKGEVVRYQIESVNSKTKDNILIEENNPVIFTYKYNIASLGKSEYLLDYIRYKTLYAGVYVNYLYIFVLYVATILLFVSFKMLWNSRSLIGLSPPFLLQLNPRSLILNSLYLAFIMFVPPIGYKGSMILYDLITVLITVLGLICNIINYYVVILAFITGLLASSFFLFTSQPDLSWIYSSIASLLLIVITVYLFISESLPRSNDHLN